MEVLGASATGQGGLAGRAAGRPDRADAPVGADPDVRRRHERDPARHDRDARARPAVQALTTGEGPVDFSLTQAQEELSALARQILTDQVTPDRLAELEQDGPASTGPCGPSWPRPESWAPPLPENAGGDGLRPARAVLDPDRDRPRGRAGTVPGARSCSAPARSPSSARPSRSRAGPAPAATGDLVITAALAEPGDERPAGAADPGRAPRAGWLLRGTKTAVPAGAVAGALPRSSRDARRARRCSASSRPIPG